MVHLKAVVLGGRIGSERCTLEDKALNIVQESRDRVVGRDRVDVHGDLPERDSIGFPRPPIAESREALSDSNAGSLVVDIDEPVDFANVHIGDSTDFDRVVGKSVPQVDVSGGPLDKFVIAAPPIYAWNDNDWRETTDT